MNNEIETEVEGRHSEPHQDFDWDGLFERMGEKDDRLKLKLKHKDRAEMAQALARIFDWILRLDTSSRLVPRIVGLRFIALAWVMNPELFEGASIRKLAKDLESAVACLSPLTAAASRDFEISNHFQRHDWRKRKTRKTKKDTPNGPRSTSKAQ